MVSIHRPLGYGPSALPLHDSAYLEYGMEWLAWQNKALEPFLVEVAKDSIREALGPFKIVESELGYRKCAAARSL